MTIANREVSTGLQRSLRLVAADAPHLYLGGVALLIAAASAIALPPSPLGIAAAGVATVALAMDRRLGPLPAALLVALTIPWGRGADTLTFAVGGLPIRPQDVAIGIGMLASLPVLVRRRPLVNPMLVLIGLLLALGAFGVVVGLVMDNPLRDMLRDVRWWALYGAAVLAMFGATTRARLLRGLIIGMVLFSVLVIVATLAPVFPGGLKDQELLYDRGTLRMQFGNSAFLLPAIAYAAAAFLRRHAVRDAIWLLVLLTAIVLSLTRASIAATALVVALAFIARLWIDRPRSLNWRRLVGDGVRLAAIGVLALGIGVTADIVGSLPPAQVAAGGAAPPGEQPLDRILLQEDRSDIESFGARFPVYIAAARTILDHPLTGAGMGSLTPVGHAFNAARAATIGFAPSVDNAYLTVGLKAGIAAMALFAAILLTALIAAVRRGGWLLSWYAPALVGLGMLTMTQAFAVSMYGPYAMALLLALPFLRWGSSRALADGALAGRR